MKIRGRKLLINHLTYGKTRKSNCQYTGARDMAAAFARFASRNMEGEFLIP